MKKNYLLFIVCALFSLSTKAQDKKQNPTVNDTSKKCKSIHHTTAGNTKPKGAGPFEVNPKTLKKKTDYKENKNSYHNEQDNFRRPDSIPYHPAPSKNDSMNNHSYNYNVEDLPSSKSTQSNPSVTFGFNAEYCSGNTPPDNAMAISNGGFIVSAVNCGIVFYNSSGQQVGTFDYPTFFNTSGTNFSDPRVIYDVFNDRFIFFIQYGCDPSTSLIYIAFSTSNDPTQTWHYYTYNVGTSNGLAPNLWFDYPSVGINQTDFCMSGNLFSGGCPGTSSGAGNLVMLFNKQDGYNGVPYANMHAIAWTNMLDGSGNAGFTIAPATAAQNISYNNVFYLVSTLSGGGSYVTIYTINGNASNNSSTYSSSNINTLQAYTPAAAATQPNGIALANYKAGCRTQNALYLNGTISFVYTADYNTGGYDYNSIYYNQFNINSNSLNQNWSYLGGSNYSYPSIASFGLNSSDLSSILCFLKSDASTNPEIRFKYFDNSMNQLASSQARAGDASVNYTWASSQRWGDYTASQRRYNAAQPELWLSGSFGNSSNYWQTYIAQITGYPSTVSVSEVNLKNEELIVYPNPVETQLYIKGDFKNMYGFPELYSLDGKLLRIDVTRKDNEMFQIDVSRISKGTYFIKFKNSQTIKFVKE